MQSLGEVLAHMAGTGPLLNDWVPMRRRLDRKGVTSVLVTNKLAQEATNEAG